MNIFSPKGFLQVAGVLLLLLGMLGFAGILGPTSNQSIFGNTWWFDSSENLANVVVGIISLLAVFVFPPVWQRYLVVLIGVVSVLVGLYNFVSPTLLGATLQIPADLVLHLVIGAWALYAVYGSHSKSVR